MAKSIPLLRASYAACAYRSPAGRALLRAKYGPDLQLMWEIGAPFSRLLAPIAIGADLIVPVPSPWTRRAVRGFASASVLARALSAASSVPVTEALSLRPGPRQAGTRGLGRSRNLTGRMSARGPISGRVILVDDVSTTGTTASHAARELLLAGATDVTLAALADASRRPSQHGGDL